MKKTLLAILIIGILLTSCISEEKMDVKFDFEYPTTENLLKTLTIKLENSPRRDYAFTDRVGGFWHSGTFSYNTDNGGYILDEGQRFFADYFVNINNNLLDRRKAASAEMHPHQFVYNYKNGVKETLTVLLEQKGMIITISNINNASIDFIPYFWTKQGHLKSIDYSDSLIAFYDGVNKKHMLLSTNHKINAIGKNKFPEDLKVNNAQISYKIHNQDLTELNYILLFGDNLKELKARMQKILKNQKSEIKKRKQSVADYIMKSYVKTNLPEYDKALFWNMISGKDLVVTQFGKGIWAGLPWFHQNWGRDTFIALPGISLVTGQYNDAKEIITAFTNFQQTDSTSKLLGRIPNRVVSPEKIIYNTADGTPWLIRELVEYINYTGDIELAKELFPVIELAIEGALKNLTDESGFIKHDPADTWMDARIEGHEPWSPRGDKAVEIQALWYNQLKVSAQMAQFLKKSDLAYKWNKLAEKVKINFTEKFINPENYSLYDHINPDGSPDLQIRPNQVFAMTVPMENDLVSEKVKLGIVKQVVSELLYKYGVASLSQKDEQFHAYHHDQIYHFDAAYHNGLGWQWVSGPVVSAMVQTDFKDLAFEHALNFTAQTLKQGMPGSIAENFEPILQENGETKLSGTFTQAWSCSEFVRNFYQDFLGIKPQMLDRKIVITPQIPEKLTKIEFVQNVALDEQIEIIFEQSSNKKRFAFNAKRLNKNLTLNLRLSDSKNDLYQISIELKPTNIIEVIQSDLETMEVKVNGISEKMQKTNESIPKADFDLKFCEPWLNPELKSLQEADYLYKIRKEEFKDYVNEVL